jgi:hypothetical protein
MQTGKKYQKSVVKYYVMDILFFIFNCSNLHSFYENQNRYSDVMYLPDDRTAVSPDTDV